jgi:hypothetical protein
MSSAVHNLQMATVEGKQPLAQLLRQTKLIAAKLSLRDVEEWVDLELDGYPSDKELPEYRTVSTDKLMLRNPYRGWEHVGDVKRRVGVHQPIAEIETLAKEEEITFTPEKNFGVTDSLGTSMATRWPQRVTINPSQFTGIVEAVRNKLLKWAIELEKRGIKGEDMNFDEREKQTASKMVLNIGTVHSIVGNANNSDVRSETVSYQATNSPQAVQGQQNCVIGNRADLSIHIADSFNELKGQVNAINEVERVLADEVKRKNPEGEALIRAKEAEKALRKAREELEDEEKPDPSRVLKWLEQAKYALKAFGLTKEIIAAGQNLEDAFHISDWLGSIIS